MVELPHIEVNEDALDNVTMINPIDFISEEQQNEIIERVKDGLRNINNPDRWLTFEEVMKRLDEKYDLDIKSSLNFNKLKLKHSKKHIRYHSKIQLGFLLPELDMEAIDKIIEEIEKTEDDPNEWIPFEEAMQQIHEEVFGEDL